MDKTKSRLLYLLSKVLFTLSLISLALYFFSLNQKEGEFESLREMVRIGEEEGEDEADGKEEEEGLDYYLIDGEVVQEELKELYLKNPDTIGWIRIGGTNIDYPVLFREDDGEYYLYKDFEGDYSFNGSIFAGAGTDIKKPDENIILYGHHIMGQKMFGALDKFEDEDFYKEHRYISFDTLRRTGKYEIIAVFKTRVYPSGYEGFRFYEHTAMDKGSFEEYVKTSRDLTPYDTPDATYGDQLITLSTCSYHAYNGRLVVVAKRIEGKEVDLEREPLGVIETQ